MKNAREFAEHVARIFGQSVPIEIIQGTDEHGQEWAWAEDTKGKVIHNAVPIEDGKGGTKSGIRL